MWKRAEQLVKAVQQEPWAQESSLPKDFWLRLMQWMEEHLLQEFLDVVLRQVHEIVEIAPDLSEPEILEQATQYMVDFLGAHSASVRIYDPLTGQMLAYGSYPFQEQRREPYIPLDGSIAGEVVKSGRPYLVPDLVVERLYQDKDAIEAKGVRSLMAVPLEIPSFFLHERDTVGVIQIYYPEKDRAFSSLEIQMAEVMARRLSFVFARKKILSLHRLNEKKEAIVRKIFLKLGSRERIKMKDVFNRVIPEMADIVNVQSCTLFSVTDDRKYVVLEAGYPEAKGYHGIGKSFAIESEPAFQFVLNIGEQVGESAYDVLTPSYVLVVDPQQSRLLSENMKRFASIHDINSILYIPMKGEEDVSHFMTFDALEKRKRYTEEEIEIFLFLGREIMKAQQMERLDDILHDFKNPAIATAGFARRLKQLLKQGAGPGVKEQIDKALDVLLEETSRLQELALSVYGVGKEQPVDLTERLKRRVEINDQAIKEQLKQNVVLKQGPFEDPLEVRCYPLHLERILDNLLNNATNAIPPKGGVLSVRTYVDGTWACAEISNTGRIAEEDRLRLLEGEGRGRGLHITHRLVRLLKGQVEVQVGEDTTTFVVRVPLHRECEEV